MLHYRELAPAPSLAAHVRCFWRLRGTTDVGGKPEPIVPDGCVELVLNLGDPFIRHVPDGAPHRQPARLVAGQITHAVTIQASGCVDLWGIRFHPWSAAAFLGASGSELRDRFLSLDEADSMLCDDLAHVDDGEDSDSQFRMIVAALARRVRTVGATDPILPGLVRFAESRHKLVSVRGLAKEAGVSVRRVQQLFRDEVGLSPKQLLRFARFQRALGVARTNAHLSWSAIAARAGFYDQAHLNHESQEIAGCTPSALLGSTGGLTDAFLAD